MKNFEEWGKKDVYFLDKAPEILVNNLFQQIVLFSIIDLGCGDGTTLYNLYKKGLFEKRGKTVGVNLSEGRIRQMSIFAHLLGV